LADFRILVPLAVLLGLLSFAPVAGAAHIQCGSVITTSVKFDSDVICPNIGEEDVALTIGASNITVNARGYRIVAQPCCDGSVMSTNGAYSGVVIKNLGGTPNFLGNIYLRLSDSKVINNRSAASYGGVSVTGSNNVIRDNRFHSGEEGGLEVYGDHNRVLDNDVHGRFGPMRINGSYNTIRRNVLSADFDDWTLVYITDFAGQGVVTDNLANVTEYNPDAFRIEGARVNKRNETVCDACDPRL